MPIRSNWLHDRCHFYKYLSPSTGAVVLKEGTLRWSSPALFNDPFDVQFDLHVSYDRESVARVVLDRMWEVYAGVRPLLPGNLLGYGLLLLRERVPGLTREQLEAEMRCAIFDGMNRAEARLPEIHTEFRSQLSSVKILCLSETESDLLMWSHYAQNHSGFVIQLTCVPEIDSAWGAAKPVRYSKTMPLLMEEDELIGLFSGERGTSMPELLHRAVFSKAADWSYEREWRLFGGDGRDPKNMYDDYGFQPRELTAVYVGCRTSNQDKQEALSIIAERYPHAAVYQARKAEREFALRFDQIR